MVIDRFVRQLKALCKRTGTSVDISPQSKMWALSRPSGCCIIRNQIEVRGCDILNGVSHTKKILCVMVLAYFCLISLYFVGGLAGEVPIIEGVLGDVPRSPSITSTTFTARGAELSNVTTPGKLRVIENSGVCGILLILASQLTLKISMQKLLQASFRLPDMAT